MADCNESAFEKLERLVGEMFEHHDTTTLDLFPTLDSINDYFKALEEYDAQHLLDIRAAIEAGANPAAYNKLRTKHGMPLRKLKCSLKRHELN